MNKESMSKRKDPVKQVDYVSRLGMMVPKGISKMAEHWQLSVDETSVDSKQENSAPQEFWGAEF